jgi:hypothetical protein
VSQPDGNGASRESRTGPSAAGDVDLHDESTRLEVERALGDVIGVIATRIVPGYERAIDEIHVVSTPEHHPKQLVRDVQSLLYAHFSISIDHRVVSVVQIDVDDRPSPNGATPTTAEPSTQETPEAPVRGEVPAVGAVGFTAAEDERPELVRVAAMLNGIDVNVTVSLVVGDRELEGTASGPASASGRRRATARATLAAADLLLPYGEIVELEGVTVDDVLGHELAVSLIHFHGPRGARTVAGTAIVHDDEHAAVARSVLDAINRQFQLGEPE